VPSLEARVPAPIVALAVASAMWFVSGDMSPPDADARVRELVVSVAMHVSGALAIAAFVGLWWAGTTFNPLKPERATKLVTGGVYAFSRNPIYLSLLLLLVAYAVRLGSLLAAAGPAVYVAYITRYQIAPEERALEAKFGVAFTNYKSRVRRWI
jgi:protein-S-isoprenylcysteine O-methyltransferase Ste14